MKRTMICLLALALFAGLALAGGQQTATYDSLNVRVHWTFTGIHEFSGLALAPDTTLWTCYPGTNTLIEVDASDPEAIDTNVYEMDSIMGIVLGIVQDTILVIAGATSTIRTININADPPEIIDSYTSSAIRLTEKWFLEDSLLICLDNNSPRLLSFVNLSDPSDIDTFATEVDPYGYALSDDYVMLCNSLLGIRCRDLTATEPPYNPKTYISIFDISDFSNPELDTAFEFNNYASDPRLSHKNCYSPSLLIEDTLLLIASNYLFYDMGHLFDIYNVSNLSTPLLCARVGDYLTEYEKRCMAYQDGYLYAGMYIYDISGYPGNDSLVGYITGQPWEIEVLGKYVYQMAGPIIGIYEFTEYDSTRQAVLENPSPRKTWEDIFLSPNPAYEMCNVRLPAPANGEISIYNILGKKVSEVKTSSLRNSYEIEIANEPNGLYLVTFRTGDKTITKKLVILG